MVNPVRLVPNRVLLLFIFYALARPGSAAPAPAADSSNLEESFLHPPAWARPWVNWFWIDGNITREGITADLEAMQRVGIGGALLMDITQDLPEGPVRFGSPEWEELFKHTVNEAARLGLQISIHNAPGWCGSGGPWITPALGMQRVTTVHTNFSGPLRFSGLLPPVGTPDEPGADIAVLAFPTPVGDGARVPGFAPRFSTAAGPLDGNKLLDGNRATGISLPAPGGHRPQFLQLQFAEPFLASLLNLTAAGRKQSFQGKLQVSDNGRSFRDIRDFSSLRSGVRVEFPPVSARYFRIVFSQASPGLAPLEFSELELTPVYRLASLPLKSGLGRRGVPGPYGRPTAAVPTYGTIRADKVLDLTTDMDSTGKVTWQVPPGNWTVLRLGSLPTGEANRPARPGGSGLECDKLSRQAIGVHFAAFLEKLIAAAGDQAGRAFAATHIDSWEVGFQNWTPEFRQEFRRRRGYDPLRYLPAFSGRVVESVEVSERFLWDVRRTIADLVADNYAGQLAELAHRHGLQLSIEAYGNGPFDSLQYAARADVPMSEFWAEPDDNSRFHFSRVMASAAHTTGKSIVAAEAFTAAPQNGRWQNYPASLKALGDGAFCAGVNRFVFHRYAHQPWLERQPGMTMGPWGIHYERTETWWEMSRPWHEYLGRCQYLLQRGLFVADVAYLTEEGAYCELAPQSKLQPLLPQGYDYDWISPETVLSRLAVRGGRLTLPDGMSYRVLALASSGQMTPGLLRKLKALVEAGATVVGSPPTKSPSLAGFPQCDAEVRALAAEIWGPSDGKSVLDHRLGQGRVICGKPLAEVLATSGAPPDFEQVTPIAGYPLHWIHRRAEDADLYFLANSNAQPAAVECSFRVSGRRPEIWYPDSGRTERPGRWREEERRTVLPLKFDPAGSLFVVFRSASKGAEAVVRVQRDGRTETAADVTVGARGEVRLAADQPGLYELQTAAGRILRAHVDAVPEPLTVSGPWELHFPPHSGAPEQVRLEQLISWPHYPNPGVKFFSGTAAYRKEFNVPAEFLEPNRRVFLDLGDVRVLAAVRVNEENCGVLWKVPFVAEITRAIRVGNNRLEIQVANLWPNRLIGDEQLPDDCQWKPWQGELGAAIAAWPRWLIEGKPSPTGRLTFSSWKHWRKDSPLLDSGLLGPVTLRSRETVVAK